MAKQTLELRWALAINPIPIYFLLFAEGGNVYASLSHANFFDLDRSAGLVHIRERVGPARRLPCDYPHHLDLTAGTSILSSARASDIQIPFHTQHYHRKRQS